MRALIVSAVAMMVPAMAAAQDEADPVEFTIDAGFASTSGNANITTINAGQAFSYTAGKFVLSQSFDVLFNETDDSTTAEQYKGNVRGDRKFGQAERFSVFLDLRGQRDRFAGISRRFEEALGVSWKVLDKPKNAVALEGAATLVQQRGTDGMDKNFPAALLAARYLHSFTEDATFHLNGEFIPNFDDGDDYRLNGEAKLLAPITGTISLSLSYLIRYDNQPETGFKKTDRFFTSGIQLKL